MGNRQTSQFGGRRQRIYSAGLGRRRISGESEEAEDTWNFTGTTLKMTSVPTSFNQTLHQFLSFFKRKTTSVSNFSRLLM